MKFISLLLVPILLSGCFVFGPSSSKSKTVYKRKIADNELVKIFYYDDPYNKLFTVIVKKGNALTDRLDIRNFPERFIIDKLILAEKGSRSVYRIVTDTLHDPLQCIDYTFLVQYDRSLLPGFVPLSEKERQLFTILSEVIVANKLDFKFSKADADRFLGWVKISY